ncbi:lipopolysaccharide biosynthesis protein [Sodalis sp. RH21]|uniref:lipopolysaccharide biosynthesis protein n=1 Tax=unclassified Sodalis (in: enterobacteria) TaxID=2636512 RepID=UPI0039B3F308
MSKINKQPVIRQTIVSGAIWSILDNAAAQAITFVIFIILARLLSPSIYGMLSISLLVSQFFRSVIFDSIATSIVRIEKPTNQDYNSALLLCFLFSLPAFLIVFFSAPIIEKIMGIDQLANVIRGTSIIILVSGLSRIHEAWLSHNMLFRPLAIRSIISISLGGVTGIFLAYKGFAVTSLVMQQVVTSLVSSITLWIVTPWKPGFSFSRNSIKSSLNFSKHVALSGITNFANQNSDIFFITYFLGAAPAGIYSAGKRIVNTLNIVLASALMRVSLPAFSRLKNNLPEFRKHYLNATYFTILITAPAFLGLAYLSHDVTLLLLGTKWIDSVPIMQIVSAIGFVISIGYYNHSVMFARDKPEWQARLTLLYAITNVIVFYIFVRFGIIVTALAFSLRTLILYPVSAWCALTLLEIKWMEYILQLVAPTFSAFAMCISLWGVDHFIAMNTGWIKVIFDIIVGIVLYSAFIFSSSKKIRKVIMEKIS